MVDSKVLMLDVYNEAEAYYVCGIINAPNVIQVVDGYAVSTNRGVDVLKYIAIPRFNAQNAVHIAISTISRNIHILARGNHEYREQEAELSNLTHRLFSGE